MVKGYYRFFDEKHSLVFLFIIAVIIVFIGLMTNASQAFGYQEENSYTSMTINGIEYKILN